MVPRIRETPLCNLRPVYNAESTVRARGFLPFCVKCCAYLECEQAAPDFGVGRGNT